MDSDSGPHLCSQLKLNNSRLCTTSFDEGARKDGWYDQYLKQGYSYFGEGNYRTE